jgi:hypothetical protein
LDGPFDLLTLRKGYFALFYPQDGHIPGLKINAKTERVKKIVFITPASKHIKYCHSGLDPEASAVMDSRFRGNDRIDIYGCRSNKVSC